MATPEEELPDDQEDITSLAEFRRSDRRAAFIRFVDGYTVMAIPRVTQNQGIMAGIVYEPGVQGPVLDSSLEMDDRTRERHGLTEDVQRVFNNLLNKPFDWPPAYE